MNIKTIQNPVALAHSINNMLEQYGLTASRDWGAVREELRTSVCDMDTQTLARYSVMTFEDVEHDLHEDGHIMSNIQLHELGLIRKALLFDKIGHVLEAASQRLEELKKEEIRSGRVRV